MQEDAPPPFWNMELFVRPDESERSYSCGAAYNVATGAFQVQLQKRIELDSPSRCTLLRSLEIYLSAVPRGTNTSSKASLALRPK